MKPASGYDTGLAAEFFVLSMLHRFGADASLTLGNKKSVDISGIRGTDDIVTINVKGVAKRNDWPVKTKGIPNPDKHYFALLCFNDRMRTPAAVPDVWIVPCADMGRFVKPYMNGSMEVFSYARVRDDGGIYRDAWHLLGCGALSTVQQA